MLPSTGSRGKTRYWMLVLSTIVLILELLPLNGAVAENTNFRLDSFIPEMFRDLEWRVSGQIGFEAHSSDRDFESARDKYDLNRSSFEVANNSQYRYRTIPLEFDLGLSIASSFSFEQGDGNRESDQGTSLVSIREAEDDTDQGRLRLQPSGTLLSYISGDLFLSIDATVAFDYEETSASSREERNRVSEFDHYITYLDSSSTDLILTDRAYDVDCHLALGWGRMYEGQFAATAGYIVQELDRHGELLAQPSHAQLLSLTELVYQYRLEHVIDSRLHRIEALSTISEFLVAEGLAAESQVAGYLIDDVWRYFPRNARRFGLRFEAGPGLRYSYQKYSRGLSEIDYDLRIADVGGDPPQIDTIVNLREERHSSFRGTSERRLPYLMARAAYARPLDLEWQLNAVCQMRYYFPGREVNQTYGTDQLSSQSWRFSSIERADDIEDYWSATLRATVEFLPTSRTTAALQVSTQYNTLEYHRVLTSESTWSVAREESDASFDGFSTELLAHLTYRIAVPTELSVKLSFTNGSIPDYGDAVRLVRHDPGLAISASLAHYIF